ncbi:MAG: TyeA family type III secretion system gatekeeper subunit [Alphaproteobacteria bacterium]|nr:TyeA family type III secretion system gatekeeper subunit [Alphaproteobacteria bacterium]
MSIATNSNLPNLGNDAKFRHINLGSTTVRPRETSSQPNQVGISQDPTLLMLEMSEELGFLKAEELAGSEEVDEDQETAFEDLISELLRKSLETQSGSTAENRNDAEALRARLIQMQFTGKNSHELEDALRQWTGGSSQKGLAILNELVQMAKDDPVLQKMGISDQLLRDFAESRMAGLQAALNVVDALSSAPTSTQNNTNEILGLYEDAICSSASILQTFQKLGQNQGIENIADWRGFLTEAVAAELAHQNASCDKVQLQMILSELKGFRTFNTLTQGVQRLAVQLPKEKQIKESNLLQTTLDYVEQPLREFPKMEDWVSPEPTARKILFFQGFRNLIKSLPDDCFVSTEQKNGLLVQPQKKIDDLTFTENI